MCAWTEEIPPSSHCSKSIVWIDWFMDAPPPSKAQVPRQPPFAS
jgi:hypothetical protein